MKYTTKKIEVGRGIVKEQEQRVALQRRKVEKALADCHPADEAQARLLVMEQSLLSMVRFLAFLERDLDSEPSLHRLQTRKRGKSREKTGKIENLADDFAARATKSVLAPDAGLDYLEGLARAMKPGHR